MKDFMEFLLICCKFLVFWLFNTLINLLFIIGIPMLWIYLSDNQYDNFIHEISGSPATVAFILRWIIHVVSLGSWIETCKQFKGFGGKIRWVIMK